MAVADEQVKRLAGQDVVYLTRSMSIPNSSYPQEVFRGRLIQALNGNWVFNSSIAGQNGTVGFDLGPVTQNTWTFAETPATGIQITINYPSAPLPAQETVVLSGDIPPDFAD
jgi:hypothetical protein